MYCMPFKMISTKCVQLINVKKHQLMGTKWNKVVKSNEFTQHFQEFIISSLCISTLFLTVKTSCSIFYRIRKSLIFALIGIFLNKFLAQFLNYIICIKFQSCLNYSFQVISYMVYNELPTSKLCLLTFLPRQPSFAGNMPCEVLLGSSGDHEASTVWDQWAHVHVRTEKNISNSFYYYFCFI